MASLKVFLPWFSTKRLDILNRWFIDQVQVNVTAAELNAIAGAGVVAADLVKLHALTATADEINRSADKEAPQVLTDTGAITVKNGVCYLNKAGVIAATLANPIDVTDDFKTLHIRSLTAQAHTVTVTGGFGNGGGGEDIATFSGAIGDGLELVALGGFWHIAGNHQVVVA